jgi:hypothetical protein
MPIKLELFGETIEQFAADLEALIAVIRPIAQATAAPVTVELPASAPEELRAVVDQQFEAEGYEATIEQRKPKPTPGKRGRRPLAAVDEAVKSLKTNGGDEPEPIEKRMDTFIAETIAEQPKPVQAFIKDDPEPREDPEGDKKFVIEKLGALFKDPAHKPLVSAFATKVAKANGVAKISELPAPPFPAIRRALEQEFPSA